MKLIYRGITYDYTPAGKQAETTVTSRAIAPRPEQHLKYRGSNYDLKPNTRLPETLLQPLASLMYRGIAYSTNG